jgi:fido (protein-threonine AMPylation protein)
MVQCSVLIGPERVKVNGGGIARHGGELLPGDEPAALPQRLVTDAFVRRLAYYLGEVNALHPFREGNGRAQRALFGQLARGAGFTLAWQHLDPVRNVDASAAIMRGDPEPMREMLDALVRDDT